MGLVEKLILNAEADVALLTKNDAHGDVFSTSRAVDFLLIAPDREKADLVCGFINDFSFGEASVDVVEATFRILVVIEMPTTQHVLHAESAFMECLAALGVLAGTFPKRALRHVLEWHELHKDELLENWELSRQRKPLKPIAPLE